MCAVRQSPSREVIQVNYAEMLQRRRKCFQLCFDLCAAVGTPIQMPEMGVLPNSYDQTDAVRWIGEDTLRWGSELLESMSSDRVGRVYHTSENSLDYQFHVAGRKKGIWTDKMRRLSTTHSVINPKYWRMPADRISMPPRAAYMRDRIMQEDRSVRKHFLVIAGTLTAHESSVTARWKEDTAFKKKTIATGKAVGRGARASAKGLGIAALGLGALAAAVVASPLAAGAAAVGAGATAVAAVDPAIVFGDVVFIGWK